MPLCACEVRAAVSPPGARLPGGHISPEMGGDVGATWGRTTQQCSPTCSAVQGTPAVCVRVREGSMLLPGSGIPFPTLGDFYLSMNWFFGSKTPSPL